MEKQFPNGFTSWQETHFEIVSFINEVLSQDSIKGIIEERYTNQGRGGIYELAEDWTDEFENLNVDRDWDGEFFDEIDNFCLNKNNDNG